MVDLKQLDKFFEDKTFIHGERLSVADLAFASLLKNAFDNQLKSEKIDGFKNLNRYYKTIINQADFAKVDNLSMFKNVQKTSAPAPAPINTQDLEEKMAAKPKDPFAVLPATTFDFDDYKRMYSNNPPATYMPYFWEKFDAQNCSIWLCEYKFESELNLVFMTSNLVRGALQRIDKARKQSFGSMCVFGEDGKNTIAGLWIWRGQDLMFKLTEDWQVDYESYEWKKLDPSAPETKELVEKFFVQDDNFVYKGKKLADGKIFK